MIVRELQSEIPVWRGKIITNRIKDTSETGSTKTDKIGASTGHTSGKITSINATITYSDGTTLTNMTEVELYSEGGDSGGIFYSYVSSTNTRYTLGILTGGNGTTTSYSKANEINRGLGTSRY